jgi:hypothetical protein
VRSSSWLASLILPAVSVGGWRTPLPSSHKLPSASQSSSATLAAIPLMVWNSWDSFGTTVTEADVKANAAWMAENLRSYEWQYVVVVVEWFVTNPTPEGQFQEFTAQHGCLES